MMIVRVMGYRVKHGCRVGFILKLCPTLKGDSMCVSVYLELVNLWLLPNTTPLHVIQFIKHHAASAFFNILFLI